MLLIDGEGIPLGVRLESSSTGEITLAEATPGEARVLCSKGRPRQKPKRVIAVRAYDSEPHGQRFKKRAIELILPYRGNNKLRCDEGGRKLQHYRRC